MTCYMKNSLTPKIPTKHILVYAVMDGYDNYMIIILVLKLTLFGMMKTKQKHNKLTIRLTYIIKMYKKL